MVFFPPEICDFDISFKEPPCIEVFEFEELSRYFLGNNNEALFLLSVLSDCDFLVGDSTKSVLRIALSRPDSSRSVFGAPSSELDDCDLPELEIRLEGIDG